MEFLKMEWSLVFICTFLLIFYATEVIADDFYEILGVSRQADDKEIRRAFKKIALKMHPDKNQVSLPHSSYMFPYLIKKQTIQATSHPGCFIFLLCRLDLPMLNVQQNYNLISLYVCSDVAYTQCLIGDILCKSYGQWPWGRLQVKITRPMQSGL